MIDPFDALTKQKEDLFNKKLQCEKLIKELLPGTTESCVQQREALLSLKAEKEKQIEELLRKQELVNKASYSSGSLPSNSRKRSRSKREDDLKRGSRSPGNDGCLDEKFDELEREHKKTRKLIREQYQEFEVIAQYTLRRIDYLQYCLNLIMEHMNIPLATLEKSVEPVKKVSNSRSVLLISTRNLQHDHYNSGINDKDVVEYNSNDKFENKTNNNNNNNNNDDNYNNINSNNNNPSNNNNNNVEISVEIDHLLNETNNNNHNNYNNNLSDTNFHNDDYTKVV
jgi:hypothetical protein